MTIRWLPPRSRKGRIVVSVAAVLVAIVSLAYLLLLTEERYSALQASRMLDRLEALRMGDPAADFERAVTGCKVERTDSEYACELISGAYSHETLWKVIWQLPESQAYQLSRLLDRAGLRAWRLTASSSIQQGHIQSVSAFLLVVGRYETLGARWRIAQQIPSDYLQADLPSYERRTLFHWFHITSLPPGQGFTVDATADSTEKELRARRINRRCLFSFRGCDGLCEILPDAVPVLKERGGDWGGWTDAPRPKCAWK